MSYAEDLTIAAEFIRTVQSDQLPRQVMLRIAVHTSYQAVLHCLQTMCADEFIGDEYEEDRADMAWHEVYRALRHDVLRRSCQDYDIKHFPPAIRELARSVYSLQQARFSADYDSRVIVDEVQVGGIVALAMDCVNKIGNSKKKDRKAFASWIMFDRAGGVKDARARARSIDPTALFPKKK